MRMGVGVGEAGGVAPSYSLIADYFPPKQRARALAVFSFGIPVGMALGILFGGIIAARVDWRVAFIVVGLAGVILAPIFRLLVRDPKRGGYDAPAPVAPASEDVDPVPGADAARGAETTPAVAAQPTFMDAVRTVLPKPTFWLLAFGAACSSVCGYGVAFWLPTFFQRSLGLSLEETAWYYSAITLFGGMMGIWLGGWLADRFGGGRRSVYPLVPACAFLVALPFFYLSLNAPNLALAFPLFLIPTALNLAWLGPVVTSVQHLAPASMRSQASAMFLLINNLVGIALGTYYFGFVSDLLQPMFGNESIRWAIYSGGAFYVLAATLLIIASRKIGKDWVD
jgi:sugar phosphate permease